MNTTIKYIFLLFFSLIFTLNINAQIKEVNNKIQINKTIEINELIHDFGDVCLGDGPLNCQYKIKNISNKPIAIYNVVTTCGCTIASWTREPIMPQKDGTIDVTFKNDQGPFPFDKNLTVYFSCFDKPIILRLRGNVHKEKENINVLFPVKIGNIGLKSLVYQGANLSQGSEYTDNIPFANLSNQTIKLGYKTNNENIEINIYPNSIKPKQKGIIKYTIKTTRNKWGKNFYSFLLSENSKTYKDSIKIWCFTKEDFSNYSENDKKLAPIPKFEKDYTDFGKVVKGKSISVNYILYNTGKTPLIIYKIDSNNFKFTSNNITQIQPNKYKYITIKFNTNQFSIGEINKSLILTTNSVISPIINIYLYGEIIE